VTAQKNGNGAAMQPNHRTHIFATTSPGTLDPPDRERSWQLVAVVWARPVTPLDLAAPPAPIDHRQLLIPGTETK
jgi:hypothetical protein